MWSKGDTSLKRQKTCLHSLRTVESIARGTRELLLSLRTRLPPGDGGRAASFLKPDFTPECSIRAPLITYSQLLALLPLLHNSMGYRMSLIVDPTPNSPARPEPFWRGLIRRVVSTFYPSKQTKATHSAARSRGKQPRGKEVAGQDTQAVGTPLGRGIVVMERNLKKRQCRFFVEQAVTLRCAVVHIPAKDCVHNSGTFGGLPSSAAPLSSVFLTQFCPPKPLSLRL